jgi:hypothetical protein
MTTASVGIDRRGSARRAVTVSCIAFAASRVLVLAATAITAATRGDDLPTALRAWDGDWYLSVVEGYTSVPPDPARPWQSNIAFFPVFPLSIRLVGAVTGLNVLDAAIVTGFLYAIALAILLGVLSQRVLDADTGTRFVWAFWLFPGTALLSLLYAEVALLTFAVLCLYALLERRWIVAGVGAGLAAASRPTGSILILCCIWVAVAETRAGRGRSAWLSPALGLLGPMTYFAYLWVKTGDAFIWFRTQRLGWDAGLDLGASAARDVLDFIRSPLGLNTTHALQLFGLGTAVLGVGLLLLWREGRPPVLALYALVTLAVPLLTRTGSAGGVRPRFVLVAFPIFMALAVRVHGLAFGILMVVSAGLLAATAIVYTTPLWVIP